MVPYDDDSQEKLSWREIDKQRDRTRHYSSEGKSVKERTLRSDWAKKQHLREAEKFFQGKKGTETYKAAHAAIHEKYGTGDFQQAMENFVQQFGVPDDWGTLLLLLDARKPEWILESLMALKKMYDKRSLIEQRGLKGKIKVLVMTTKDKNIRQECEKILEGL